MFPCPRTCQKKWSRETGSAISCRVSLLILYTQAGSGAYSRDSSRFPRRRPFIHLNCHAPLGQCRLLDWSSGGSKSALLRKSLTRRNKGGTHSLYSSSVTPKRLASPSTPLLFSLSPRAAFTVCRKPIVDASLPPST